MSESETLRGSSHKYAQVAVRKKMREAVPVISNIVYSKCKWIQN